MHTKRSTTSVKTFNVNVGASCSYTLTPAEIAAQRVEQRKARRAEAQRKRRQEDPELRAREAQRKRQRRRVAATDETRARHSETLLRIA